MRRQRCPGRRRKKYSREAAINTVLELAIEDTVKLGDGPWRLDLGGYPRYVACTRCGPQAMAGYIPHANELLHEGQARVGEKVTSAIVRGARRSKR